MVVVPSAGDQMGPGGAWRFGPGSYVYEQRGLFDGTISRSELKHFGLTSLIGLALGNPVVSIGIGLIHWNYHILKPLFTSSGGGGPGEVLTSAVPPSTTSGGAPISTEDLGRLINSAHGGGRSGAKPRKRCPPGFRWDGRRCVSKG